MRWWSGSSRSPLAAMLAVGCAPFASEPARPAPAPPRAVASSAVTGPTRPPASSTATATSEAKRPLCSPKSYPPDEVFTPFGERDCDLPEYCSAEYWAHLKERARQTGPTPSAETFARSACVLRTAHAFLQWVTVTPEGEAPFLVQVSNVPATVVPGGRGEPSAVEVRGVLTFRGLSGILSFGVDPALSLAGGRFFTGTLTRAVPQKILQDRVEAALHLADDVTASPVTLPCSALRVTEEPYPPPTRTPGPPDGSRALRAPSIALYANPSGGSPIDVAITLVTSHESSGARTRIRQSMDDGAVVSGWVTKDALGESDGGGGIGYGFGGGSCGCPQRVIPTLRIATRAGLPVYARAGGGRWASFTVSVEFNAVEVDAEWLWLEGLWGFGLFETFPYQGSQCDDLRVFVRRADVRSIGPASYG